MKILKIEKGWFYGAGSPKMFNWAKDGYHIWGVGIALDFIYKTTETQIEIAGATYLLQTQDAVDFARKYNSQETRGGRHLIVVSKSILVPLEILKTIEV